MRIGWKAAGAAAAVVAGLAGAAQAQTPEDMRRLDRLSQGNLANRPVAQRPLPVPSGSEQQLVPLRRLWTCMSAVPNQPVLAEPRPGAQIIGYTLPHVATNGATVNGYGQVLHTNGFLGYVPAWEVTPFRSNFKPGAQCKVLGVKPGTNTPVFEIR